jgi:RNA polymerase sigma-70 factor (ECF subfamily)
MTTGALAVQFPAMTEEELVQGCKTGRREAYDELVSRYYDRIFRLAYAMAGPETARDLAQETFMAAVKSFPNFRGESQVATWLISILRNQCSLHRRSERKWKLAPLEGEDERLSAPEPRKIETAIRTILDRMRDLPDDLRMTLVLFYIEGLKYTEIAQAMGCPVGTVRSRLFEARERLKASLAGMEN